MKKLFTLILASVLISVSLFSGCAKKEKSPTPKEKVTISVMALKGPTGMGMAKLITDSKNNQTENKYNFSIVGSTDEVVAAVVNGSVDVAAVPVNLASVLYAKTKGDVKIAAVNTLGVLYIIENGNTINSVEDLKGKTLYATGQGANPEYVLDYILSKNGIDPDKDLKIEFKTEHTELAALMTSGDAKLGMLPEPNVTTVLSKNSSIRIALDLTKEWEKINGKNTLVQGCLIVRKEFLENNKDEFNKFLDEYKASVNYTNSNIEEASALIAQEEIVPSAAIAKAALPNCNICYIEGDEMITSVKDFLNILFEASAPSVGGVLPDEGFYYKR